MMKCLRFASLCCVLAVVTGCGGARELPPKAEAGDTKVSSKEGKEKAMQGMPDDIRRKMESQYKMKR